MVILGVGRYYGDGYLVLKVFFKPPGLEKSVGVEIFYVFICGLSLRGCVY